MPARNKPLPPEPLDPQTSSSNFLFPSSPELDLVAQMREATYSPSPLTKILHDPTLIPRSTREYKKEHDANNSGTPTGVNNKRPSRSPGRREHRPRSPFVAAIAIIEEERQAQHLKSLLRACADRLEHEIRRAEDERVRADFLERQERDAITRAKAAERSKEELRDDAMKLERDTRDMQIMLEATQRETRRVEDDLMQAKRELEEMQHVEMKAQETIKRYEELVQDMRQQMRLHEIEVQSLLQQWHAEGKEDGYNEGYDAGYEEGRKAGLKAGLKKGRREGVLEGREEGRIEERRNAVDHQFFEEEEMSV